MENPLAKFVITFRTLHYTFDYVCVITIRTLNDMNWINVKLFNHNRGIEMFYHFALLWCTFEGCPSKLNRFLYLLFNGPGLRQPRPSLPGGTRGGEEEQWLVLQTIHRFHNRFLQSRRRPLLGPSPGWKCPLALSHLRHYAKWAVTPPQ